MTKPGRVLDSLGHILQAIERIDRYTADLDDVGFLKSELVQDAVIRNIEIVGEAANRIQRVDAEFATEHDEIPWQVMYTMRNRVSHGYEQVDLEIVWKTIRGDLPTLHAQVKEVLADLHRNDDNQGVTP